MSVAATINFTCPKLPDFKCKAVLDTEDPQDAAMAKWLAADPTHLEVLKAQLVLEAHKLRRKH